MGLSKIVRKIETWLSSNGYKIVLDSGNWKQHKNDCWPNEPGVVVQPDYYPTNGKFYLLITPTEVLELYSDFGDRESNPHNAAVWKTSRRHLYGSHDQLKSILDSIVILDYGCWKD